MDYIIQQILAFFSIDISNKRKIKSVWYPLFFTMGSILVTIIFICFICPYFWDIKLTEGQIQIKKQEYFVSFLIIISNVFVGYNTNMFISDADDIILKFISPITDESPELKLRKYNGWFKWINKLTFAFSFVLIVFYLLNICGVEITLKFLFYLNEFVIIAMFLSFCAADFIMLKMLNITLPTNPSNKSLIALNNFTKSAFPLIDIAGCAGAILIGIISSIIHFHIHEYFAEGFAIGALAFHIIFTQVNFVYLKTVEIRESTN